MIAITMLKIDSKGRIALPSYFLKANDIKTGSTVAIYPVYNREDSVRLQFDVKEIKNGND